MKQLKTICVNSLSDTEKESAFHDYISGLGETQKAEFYLKIMGIPIQDVLDGAVNQAMSGMGRKEMEEAFIQAMQELSMPLLIIFFCLQKIFLKEILKGRI